MAKLIHSMIRVTDLQRSIDFYHRALDLNIAGRFDLDTFTLVYLNNDESEFELELTCNHNRTEPYSHGDGYGHLGVSVDDAGEHHDKLTRQGLLPSDLTEYIRDGVLISRFFFVTDPDGYKIEFLQRCGRFH